MSMVSKAPISSFQAPMASSDSFAHLLALSSVREGVFSLGNISSWHPFIERDLREAL
jgi:hypothetical protein